MLSQFLLLNFFSLFFLSLFLFLEHPSSYLVPALFSLNSEYCSFVEFFLLFVYLGIIIVLYGIVGGIKGPIYLKVLCQISPFTSPNPLSTLVHPFTSMCGLHIFINGYPCLCLAKKESSHIERGMNEIGIFTPPALSLKNHLWSACLS